MNKRTSRLLIAAAASALALAGCSSVSEADPALPSSGSASAESVAAQATAAYEGIVGAPPTELVAIPQGVSAWIVSCGQNLPTCSDAANGTAEAAAAIGWDNSICDGKLNPEGWASCIRQGIANHADVVFVIGQDCSAFEGPLQEARDAGVMTIGVGANDCDVVGREPLFTATTQRYEGMSNEDWWNRLGALQAKWLIGQTNGKLRLLEVQMADSQFGPWISAGLNEELSNCGSCTVVDTLRLTNADVGSGAVGQKFSSALLQAGDANAIAVPVDPWLLAGISQGVEASGRSADLSVMGAFGQQGNLDLIRNNQGQDASVAFSLGWEGWAGVDTALRTMAGQDVLPAGMGLQVVDQTENMPEVGTAFSYSPVVDFKAKYQEAWGIK